MTDTKHEDCFCKVAPHIWGVRCYDLTKVEGDTYEAITKKGKPSTVVLVRYLGQRKRFTGDIFNLFLIEQSKVRDIMQRKADRRKNRAESATNKADKLSDEGSALYDSIKESLAFGQPNITDTSTGRAAKKRKEKAFDRIHNKWGQSQEMQEKAKNHLLKAEHFEYLMDNIFIDDDDALDMYQAALEKAKEYHAKMKSGEIERPHGMALQYAKNKINDIEKRIDAVKWLYH